MDIERAQAPAPTACVHRWQVTGATGDTAAGTCRLCGSTREFTNAKRGWLDRSVPQRSAPAPAHPPVRGN